MRVLLIEADTDVARNVTHKLQQKDYVCDVVENLSDGEYYMDIRYYDLVLVDWGLAEGTDFLRAVHHSQPKAATIVLSNCGDTKNEITALHKGADDYLRKPFDLDVLLARIESSLRRYGVSHLIEIDGLSIDSNEETVSYQGRPIELRGKPFEVFARLALHHQQIISKEQLLDAIWIEPELVTPNVIDVAINQIRQKIDKRFNIVTIETVRRRGYRFCFPECSSD